MEKMRYTEHLDTIKKNTICADNKERKVLILLKKIISSNEYGYLGWPPTLKIFEVFEEWNQ